MQAKKRDIDKLLGLLSLEQKISLLVGKNFWETVAFPTFNLPSVVMNDGPFGLRKPRVNEGGGLIDSSSPATAFPTTSALASSFDESLLYQVGEVLAKESKNQEVDILLGPGVNIKRNPLCGRNFEYFSEDPLVTAKLATSLVKGLEENGVHACVKHFAVNNQETKRYQTNAIVDERALYELYLKPFADIIENGKPGAIMCSYNQVNGRHASRNKRLLSEILRDEFHFDGLVVSDWGAVVNLEDSVNAGLNLEMPGPNINIDEVLKSVNEGKLSEETIDKAITPTLNLMLNKRYQKSGKTDANYDKHFEFAGEVASECAVLLQNKESFLPLSLKDDIAIIGSFAKSPRYQGSGSSKINPYKLGNLFETLQNERVKFSYAEGYDLLTDKVNDKLVKEAVEVAKKAKKVVILAGLPDVYEVEGYDRTKLDMPPSHNELIKAISEVNDQVAVVLASGSPILMPWLSKVKSVLHMHLAGANSGKAIYDLLFGHKNPSGKLAETYPLSLGDTPQGNLFGSSQLNTPYLESIYVGYRYYEKARKNVLFPFGFGLSYTNFALDNIKCTKEESSLKVSFTLENKGPRFGKEVVQLYIGKQNSALFNPLKELKAFAKIGLMPGVLSENTLEVNLKDLAYYDTHLERFVIEETTYNVYLGTSSEDATLISSVFISGEKINHFDHLKTLVPNYYDLQKPFSLVDFKTLYVSKLPLVNEKYRRPFTLEQSIGDTRSYLIGRIIEKVMKKTARKMAGEDKTLQEMAASSISELPFRSIKALSSGAINEQQIGGILDIVNGHYIRGARKFFGKKSKIIT